MPNIFRVTSSEGGRLQLEAAAPSTAYADTIFHAAGPFKEYMQLELDLFPSDPDENVSFTAGQTVRLVNLARVSPPELEPEPEQPPKLHRKLGAKF